MATLSKRMSVLSMAAPNVERRAFPACSSSFAGQSSVSSAAAGPCKCTPEAHRGFKPHSCLKCR